MEFLYKYAHFPNDEKLLISINSASKRLYDKLEPLNVDVLDISDYNKVYLNNRKSNLIDSIKLYSNILAWSLADSNVPLNKFIFLDYGGGSGILSLLAKELGLATLIYNDIYDVSCRDAEIIAKSIGSQADHYIQGDGRFPQEPTHSINTCDPYTGNWAEHLMDPYNLKEILSSSGFELKILSGYYGDNKNIIKKVISRSLNLAIYSSKSMGPRIAPFITIYGKSIKCNLLK